MKITLLDYEGLEEIGTIELNVVPVKDDSVLYNDTVYLVMSILYSEKGTSLIVRENPRYSGGGFVV